MWRYPELDVMFISIKNKMLSYEQFRSLIHNVIRLYKNGCALQQLQSTKNPILYNIEKSIPILFSEAYGNVIAEEIIRYVKDESEYTLEEIYSTLDDFSKMISKNSAIAIWKLKELYPNNDMIIHFSSIINDRCQ